MKRFKDRSSFAFLLNLFCPGLGHLYWREYIFGIFIFLVTLLAAALFFFSILISLPTTLKVALFGLPLIFYLFTFVDLGRAVNRKKGISNRSITVAVIFVVVASSYQVLAPIAPINFLLRNRPEIFRMPDNSLSPYLARGDVAAATPLAYKANLFFLERPVWHHSPRRGDIVRATDLSNTFSHTGLVLGLPGEGVEIIDGQLYVNEFPQPPLMPGGRPFAGDMSLTIVDQESILIAELNLGVVNRTYQVPLEGITGQVHRLF